MIIFLDTNILLDLFLERDQGEAKQMIDSALYNNSASMYISDISIINTYYILNKYASKANALSAVKLLLKYCYFAEISLKIINQAASSDFSDFEDAVQYYCAMSINSKYIITNNKKDFTKSEIPIVNASEWLDL